MFIVYDGWKPVLEDDVWSGVSWNVYGPGPDEILYRHDAIHGDLRYHLDRMGNVAFLLDADGDGIEKYSYDAFGKPTVTTWSGTSPRSYSWYGNRFMFTGREYFSELGIYDYRNRFYYPALGRFLQSDPLGFGGGDANLFRYCGGDPVNWRDPNGLQDIPLTPSQDYINGLTAQYYTEQSAGITAVNNYISAFNTGISITSSPEYRATFGAVQVVASFVTAEESVALLGTPAEPIGVGGLIMSVHEFSSGIDHIRAAGNGEVARARKASLRSAVRRSEMSSIRCQELSSSSATIEIFVMS